MKGTRGILLALLFFPVVFFGATDWTTVELDNPERFVQGEVTLRLKPGVKMSTLEETFQVLNAVQIDQIEALNAIRLKLGEGVDVGHAIKFLQTQPWVLYAEPIAIVSLFFTPNDPLFPNQWNFDANHIDMPSAWDKQTGSSDVVAAIIDSGIAYEDYPIPSYELSDVLSDDGNYHIAQDLTATQFVAGYDFVKNDDHPNDCHGHGTHVAGTVAQATDNSTGVAGMAFDCKLMPVRVMNRQGSGNTFDIADGISWAADNGADAINMSFGGPPGDQSGMGIVHDAIIYATDQDVVCVAAAGNAGVGLLSYPAGFEECIAVAACDYNDQRAPYSQYGSGLDISAPGGNTSADENSDGNPDGVLQCTYELVNDEAWGGSQLATVDKFAYHFWQGTSMSAPHVTGLVALLKSDGINDVDSIKTAIYETARDLGAPGYDQTYGYGMIDPSAALDYYSAPQPPVADFDATPRSGPAPLDVQFEDLSTGDPTSWDWDFGDGFNSSVAEPLHTYDAEGTYTVTLVVANSEGEDTTVKENFITVGGSGDPPVAEFSASPRTGDAPLEVTFDDLSTNSPSSWSWDFGDGQNSTESDPVHTYDSEGTYTVSLTVENAYGSDTETKTDYITVGGAPQPPTAAFSANPETGPAPLEVQFTDESSGGPTSWSWEFGDGGSSNEENPSYTYDDTGTYTVTLTVSNAQGSDETTGTITVTEPLAAAFTADPTTGYVPLTSRMEVTFSDQSTGSVSSWDWDFGDGASATEPNPVHTYKHAGEFVVWLRVSDGSSQDSTSDTIRLVSSPSEFFASSPSLASQGEGQVEIEYGAPRLSTITLSVYDASGQLVKRLFTEEVPVGEHTTTWDLRDRRGVPVSPGVYFIDMRTLRGHVSSKIIITR